MNENKILRLAAHTYFIKEKMLQLLKKNRRRVYKGKSIDLESILSEAKLALFHVGLKNIQALTAEDSFQLVFNLANSLPNYAIPAFTPSFRQSLLFSLKYSIPEVGKFSKLAFEVCNIRTKDPIHSLFFKSENIHQGLVEDDTFHADGIYSLFVNKDVYWVNIGTDQLVSTVLHYLERLGNVPYLEKEIHTGYFHEESFRLVTHTSYKYNCRVTWNRQKIERDLMKSGAIIARGYWNGAFCRVIDAQKATKYILNRMKKNPYYLVM